MKKGKQMSKINFLQTIYLKDKLFYFDKDCQKVFENNDNVSLGRYYSDNHADALLVFDLSIDDSNRQEAILSLKKLVISCEIPVYVSGELNNFEDVKKYIYTGAEKLVFFFNKEDKSNLIKESVLRFGKDKFLFAISDKDQCDQVELKNEVFGLELLFTSKDSELNHLISILDLKLNGVLHGISIETNKTIEFLDLKDKMENKNYEINIFKSPILWTEIKLNTDGLIPVIVQDYKSNEVLMLAYMNEKAFDITVKTGKMTFYSRSRQEIWTKGLTSGHFQYLKSLTLDCDNDTILAKVSQVGVACHTGEVSCFFQKLIEKNYKETDMFKVFENVYSLIKNRKTNPKEGSYTTYLFDKGIDKILKKVGEEATEIIIAAKNPDSEEIIYEVSDFLYHVMVLMVEKDVSWEEIIRELSNRQ